ncbi:aminotransferase class IV [Aequorivita xiaoshiensis]|uniref:branched-chain-amino-acid transaminase n=1 Tax=Aequorivita xiaoshiensis TaxID=2874476 RepID=A0A9X1UD81_9FLAO|nr:aminotransferase class IV [Aequorivita xiaoshiensis]MCG2431356.1 aminotransferase class IV [Aequorivita xiaoshiensis]
MINLNGKIVKEHDASITINNRGLHYGDAVFETMRYGNEKIYFWNDHFLRLKSSLKILKLEGAENFSSNFLKQEISRTIAAQASINSSYRVKLLVWRKTGGKYTPFSNEVEYAIMAEPLASQMYPSNTAAYIIGAYDEHLVSSGELSTLKSNNRLINVLGSVFAKDNGFDNCFLLNEKNNVVEALNGNLFIVSGKTIITPPIHEGCLNGVMRKQLIAIVQSNTEYLIKETSISVMDLHNADEIFITNVIQGIVPVSRYKEEIFEDKVAKVLLQKLNEWVTTN